LYDDPAYLNSSIVPKSFHQLTDLVGQLAFARLAGQLEEEASVLQSEKQKIIIQKKYFI
jgi:hypothetical protein